MVFELYRALEPAEIRSIRRHLQTQPKLLALFDQLGPDPSKVRKARPANRHRLHRAMLEGLVQLDSDNTAEARLLHMAAEAEALSRRGLIAQARRILERAVHLAREHEALFCMPLLEHRLHALERATFYSGLTEVDVDQASRRQAQNLSRLDSIRDRRCAHKRVYLRLHAQGNARSKTDREAMALLDAETKAEQSPNCREARIYDHSRRFQMAYYRGQFEEAAAHARAMRVDMESNPIWIEDHPVGYISALNNEMLSWANAGKQEAIPDLLVKLENLPVRTRFLRAQVFMALANRGLSYHLITGTHAEGLDMEPMVLDGLRRYGDLVHGGLKSIFRFNLACLAHGAGERDRALDLLRDLMEHSPPSKDVEVAARLLDVVLRRETGRHNALAESRWRTLNRMIKANKARYTLEWQVALALRSWIHHPTEAGAWRAALERLGAWLAERRADGSLDPMLKGVDWEAWWLSSWTEAQKTA